ncbi:deoxyguanosinetriphosphate triphosphohydrolase [Candidatus Aerophobetes bacterium]|nr:deoxyguanosinetriphosphate triphosphohydrolase [Candidatus Aerophobetes bacterium]
MRGRNRIFDREAQEEWEKKNLSCYAALSFETRGREKKEIPCPLRTEFQRDRDRIIHSKAFRRLKHKTQVFIAPFGDHYRTRLTHTLEVSQIARTISRALRLNEDLTEAIALGHDLGHTPFGHIGEYALNEVYPAGFCHNEHSLRVVDRLEGNGGLNLTREVRDGILNHSQDNEKILSKNTKSNPLTLEAEVVKIADPLAYVNHDIDDALRANLLKIEDLPLYSLKILGKDGRARIAIMVKDVVVNSFGKSYIQMSPLVLKAFNQLRDFMYEKVYFSPALKEEVNKASSLISSIYQFYINNPLEVPPVFRKNGENIERAVVDYIAGMTDRFALNEYQKHFIPREWG